MNDMEALELFCLLGPATANAPQSNLQVALVPAEASSSIVIQQTREDGNELFFH